MYHVKISLLTCNVGNTISLNVQYREIVFCDAFVICLLLQPSEQKQVESRAQEQEQALGGCQK